MEEEMTEITEKKIEISEEVKNFANKKPVFYSNSLCKGCGSLLGLKIALQATDCMLVVTPGCMSDIRKYLPTMSMEVKNASAFASGISKKILIFAGDGMTDAYLQSILSAAERNENVLYICNNNQGYCYLGVNKEKSFARLIPANYVATASISHPEDYIRKLNKANAINGFRFIDLFCPCPKFWGFDPSNTIQIARIAVETGFWPLYEIMDKKVEITVKTPRLEPLERYFSMQKRYKDFKEIGNIKEKINKNYRLLSEGKLP